MSEALPGLRCSTALLGPTLEPIDDVWFTFDHGRISAVGTGAPPRPLPTANGSFVMPGLVDCHTHLALAGGADVVADLDATDEAARRELIRLNARRQLMSGVTTVRDLGSPEDIVLTMAEELRRCAAPTLIGAGAVSSPQGHGCFLAAHATEDVEYLEQVVRLARGGAKWLKLFATGGVITNGTVPGAPQMPLEQMQVVVAAAQAAGLRVAAHAHGLEGIRNALRAGVDSVEHFSYLTDEMAHQLAQGPPRLVSTLVATERFVAVEDVGGSSAEAVTKIHAHAPHERAALRAAVAAGVSMGVGTDAGTTFNPHGGGMQEQGAALVQAGMTTQQAVHAMTVLGARLVGCAAGELSVGRDADLLVLGSDPTADITALADLQSVVARGRHFLLS